jgi:hypothetical protein
MIIIWKDLLNTADPPPNHTNKKRKNCLLLLTFSELNAAKTPIGREKTAKIVENC